MTSGEYAIHIEGYADRLMDQKRLLAVHASWVMTPHTKKRVTPRKLLGAPKGFVDAKLYGSVEEFRAAVKARRAARDSDHE